MAKGNSSRALPFVLLVAAVVSADALIRCLQRTARLTHEMNELGVLSRTDPLTGLPNRRHLEEHLAAQLSAARRALATRGSGLPGGRRSLPPDHSPAIPTVGRFAVPGDGGG